MYIVPIYNIYRPFYISCMSPGKDCSPGFSFQLWTCRVCCLLLGDLKSKSHIRMG